MKTQPRWLYTLDILTCKMPKTTANIQSFRSMEPMVGADSKQIKNDLRISSGDEKDCTRNMGHT